MLVFHTGILTETERSKVVKCKPETHPPFFFLAHNSTAATHKTHLCGGGMEHKEKPVMQHPRGEIPQAVSSGPLCYCFATLGGCCGWGEEGAAGREGMWRCAGTRNSAEQAGSLEELVPNVMCSHCLSRCGVCLVSQLLANRKGLKRASVGEGRKLWQRGAGRKANGQHVPAAPTRKTANYLVSRQESSLFY